MIHDQEHKFKKKAFIRMRNVFQLNIFRYVKYHMYSVDSSIEYTFNAMLEKSP